VVLAHGVTIGYVQAPTHTQAITINGGEGKMTDPDEKPVDAADEGGGEGDKTETD